MLKSHSAHNKHRFAWLTPMPGQKSSIGPWTLCENRTQHLTHTDSDCVNVTVGALLHLLANALNATDAHKQNSIESECGRFKAVHHRNESDSSRLFVQQRSDYFQRLELFVDEQLVVAFHEPVWPHLQRANLGSSTRMNIPQSCISLLETQARNSAGPNIPAQEQQPDEADLNQQHFGSAVA